MWLGEAFGSERGAPDRRWLQADQPLAPFASGASPRQNPPHEAETVGRRVHTAHHSRSSPSIPRTRTALDGEGRAPDELEEGVGVGVEEAVGVRVGVADHVGVAVGLGEVVQLGVEVGVHVDVPVGWGPALGGNSSRLRPYADHSD